MAFRQVFYSVLLVTAMLAFSGCKNAFSEFANVTSDDAILFDASQLADDRKWTEAIAKIGEMSAAGQAKRETKYVLASYYAGRCGLDLLKLATDISDGLTAAKNLMPILSESMAGAVIADADDCETAETIIHSISAVPANRTADENVELAMLEFAKIGAVLVSSGADANADGTLDTDHTNTCALTTVPGGQTYSPAQRLGAGITNAYAALVASGSTIGSTATAAMASMCSDLDTAYGPGFCSQYLPGDFTAGKDDGIAALILSNEIGYNLCGGSIGTGTCICP